MPPAPVADPSGPISLALAGLILVAAVFLGWRQWREHRSRPGGLTVLDENHFAREDLRRLLGTIILVLLATGIAAGGQIPAVMNGRANLKFIQVWSGVILLIVILLFLGLLDMISTRIYARRLRQRLAQEGLSIVEAELRIRMAMRSAEDPTDGEPWSNESDDPSDR